MMNAATDIALFDPSRLDTGEALPRAAYREALRHAREVLFERFRSGEDIRQLVSMRAWVIDQILAHAWQTIGLDAHPDIALAFPGRIPSRRLFRSASFVVARSRRARRVFTS